MRNKPPANGIRFDPYHPKWEDPEIAAARRVLELDREKPEPQVSTSAFYQYQAQVYKTLAAQQGISAGTAIVTSTQRTASISPMRASSGVIAATRGTGKSFSLKMLNQIMNQHVKSDYHFYNRVHELMSRRFRTNQSIKGVPRGTEGEINKVLDKSGSAVVTFDGFRKRRQVPLKYLDIRFRAERLGEITYRFISYRTCDSLHELMLGGKFTRELQRYRMPVYREFLVDNGITDFAILETEEQSKTRVIQFDHRDDYVQFKLRFDGDD